MKLKHRWIYNHPSAPRESVYYCPHCRCWTANAEAYRDERCDGRVVAIRVLDAKGNPTP